MIIVFGLKEWIKGQSWIYKPYQWVRDTICKGNPTAAKISILAVIVLIMLIVALCIIIPILKKKKNKKAVKNDASNETVMKKLESDESLTVTEPIKNSTASNVTNNETNKIDNSNNVEVITTNEVETTKKVETTDNVANSNVTTKNKISKKSNVNIQTENVNENKNNESDTINNSNTKEENKMATATVKKTTTKETKVSTVQGKFEVYPVGDVFMYRLKASNGEILVTSELYSSLKGAKTAIDTVVKNVTEGSISITKDKHNYYQFKLFGSNKRLLVASANYPSQDRCASAAESFKKFAVNAKVVELEKDDEQLMEEISFENKGDSKKGGKIIISVDDGEFDFKLTANNGVVIASSEIYKSKAGTISGIETFKQAVANGKFFVIKDKRSMYQFKLYSSAGRAVVYGEVYKNKAQAISAANSVSSFIDNAEIVDSTKDNNQ